MRILTDREVLALDKFLVDGNEDAIGIEIHKGIYSKDFKEDRMVGYSEPECVQHFSLDELSKMDVITINNTTFCALVGDILYGITQHGEVFKEKLEDTFIYGFYWNGAFDYEKIIVKYKPDRYPTRLTDFEVFMLQKILVKNNKSFNGVRIETGTMGTGGSNTSGFSADTTIEYSLEELDGAPRIKIYEDYISAIVNDVLYAKYGESLLEYVWTLNCRRPSTILKGRMVDFDTVSATRITMIFTDN